MKKKKRKKKKKKKLSFSTLHEETTIYKHILANTMWKAARKASAIQAGSLLYSY